MNSVEPKDPNFILSGWLPTGTISLGYGEGGIGKSTVILDLASRLSKGQQFNNFPNDNEPGDTIFLVAEDSLEFTVRPRIDAAGADASRIHVINTVETITEDGEKSEMTVSLRNHKSLIIDAISSVANPLLLVVDPIGQFVTGDMYRDNEVRETTSVLAEIAEHHQLAVVMIAHEGKDQGRGAKNRYLDSVAFRNAARSAFWFTEDPEDDDRKLIYHTKSNLGPIMRPMAYRLTDTEHKVAKVEWCSESIGLSADEVVTRQKNPVHKSKRVEAKDFILETLSDGNWLKVSDLDKAASSAGFSRNTLARAKQDLKADGEIRYSRDGESNEWFVKSETILVETGF
jgi:putative DNA primase/helicase